MHWPLSLKKRIRLDSKEFSTLHGRFVLKRPYFYCPDCGKGFHPLDEILEAAPENHQYDIQEKSTLSAAQLPLMCYQIVPAKFVKTRAFLNNQFGSEVLDATAIESVCVPTLKQPLP